MTSREKIRPQHLARSALVYIRQSTLGQVRHNHESQRRQYELAEKARNIRELGGEHRIHRNLGRELGIAREFGGQFQGRTSSWELSVAGHLYRAYVRPNARP